MTGPHKPTPGGVYHEQPGRRLGAPEAAEHDRRMAELDKRLGALQQAVTVLADAVTSSNVANPTAAVDAPAAPAAAADHPKPSRTPASDPALTRAERKVKLLGAGIGVLIPLSAVLTGALGVAWSYIQGYADDRAARAIEIEENKHAREQIDEHEDRLGQIAAQQTTLVLTVGAVQTELVDLRRYRELQRLEATYSIAVTDALVHHRKPPAKTKSLLDLENALGILPETP